VTLFGSSNASPIIPAQLNNERRMQEGIERDLMAKEEVISMAIEQVTRSDTALQAKLAALKKERIRAEAGEYSRCRWCSRIEIIAGTKQYA
jgi:hypothetical protein